MTYFNDDGHFRAFAANLEKRIASYEIAPQKSRLHQQREQLKTLLALEHKFKSTLIRHPWGPNVYKKFLDFILVKKKNVLAARPYFRERQSVFKDEISSIFKKRSDRGLYKFKINYNFVLFAMQCNKWPAGGKLASLAKSIHDLRIEIMEQNLPLAISQTRIFWSNTPESHLSYMDLIQIHCLGLLIGIDKFVPALRDGMTEAAELAAYRTFRPVAIGRMVGDRIKQYSETLIHYWPGDKKKLYRANKARRIYGDDFEKISEFVNSNKKGRKHKTTPEEIASLLASSSTVSGDSSVDEEGDTTLERCHADAETRPDLQFEEFDAIIKVRNEYKGLSMLENKYLQLKGISI